MWDLVLEKRSTKKRVEILLITWYYWKCIIMKGDQNLTKEEKSRVNNNLFEQCDVVMTVSRNIVSTFIPTLHKSEIVMKEPFSNVGIMRRRKMCCRNNGLSKYWEHHWLFQSFISDMTITTLLNNWQNIGMSEYWDVGIMGCCN